MRRKEHYKKCCCQRETIKVRKTEDAPSAIPISWCVVPCQSHVYLYAFPARALCPPARPARPLPFVPPRLLYRPV
jgi:hypothetical protein